MSSGDYQIGVCPMGCTIHPWADEHPACKEHGLPFQILSPKVGFYENILAQMNNSGLDHMEAMRRYRILLAQAARGGSSAGGRTK